MRMVRLHSTDSMKRSTHRRACDVIERSYVQLDEPLPPLFGDVEVAVNCYQVLEAAELAGQAIRPAERLVGERGQVIDGGGLPLYRTAAAKGGQREHFP
jgi:hypothetical protein